jgi:hypothetical protein
VKVKVKAKAKAKVPIIVKVKMAMVKDGGKRTQVLGRRPHLLGIGRCTTRNPTPLALCSPRNQTFPRSNRNRLLRHPAAPR